jgi:uncharacterized protein
MIESRTSRIHGTGAFAAQELKAGECIGLYEGRRYTARQAALRDWDQTLTYVFGLSNGSVIDASEGGNATRHLNHSCEPNVEACEIAGPRGRLQIVFHALRDLKAGEELLLDYQLVVDETACAQDYRCGCRAVSCRGTMVGVAEPAAPAVLL